MRGGGGLWPGTEEVDYTFAYEETAEEKSAVSVLMPVLKPFYQGNGQLHPVFEMNLPEGRLREAICLRFAKAVEDFDDLTMLGIVGASTIGRLRYATRALGDISSAQSICDLTEVMSYSGSEDLLAYLLEKYATNSGVAGVQPKVLVQDNSKASLSEGAKARLTVRDTTHILKTWENEYPQLAANEFFCMQAAARAGLTVPEIELSRNGKFLAVNRFDLDRNTGRYLGFEDFCVLCGYPSAGKYKDSYERLAKGLGRFLCGDALVQAQHDFFKMMVLNCMVRNGDAHLKNFGILYDHPAIANRTLAPAFDIITSKVYLPRDSMALTLNGTKLWPDKQVLSDFGHLSCQLQHTTISHIMEEVAEAVTDTRQDIQEYADDHPAFRVVGSGMLDIWNEGVNLLCGNAPVAKGPQPGM